MNKVITAAIAIIILFSVTLAQQKAPNVTIAFPQHTVEYFARPSNAKAPALPLVLAKTKTADQFGLNFQGVTGTAPFIELLDSGGKVVSVITVNDFLGKPSSKGVKLLSSIVAGTANRSDNVFEIPSAQGKYLLTVSSMATADRSTKETPAKLLLRITVKNNPANITSARVTLPVDGTAETMFSGFTIVGKKSVQPLFSTVFPKPGNIAVDKKNIVITTTLSKSVNESLVLFLSVDAANTKEEASSALQAYEQKNDVNISIVNVSDKASAQPNDTLTYHIICTNSGKDGAQDIVISNPVSITTRYLEESAVGEDTEISYDRAPATAPQIGAVRTIRWKLLKILNAGEERIVSFKVIVQ